MLHTGESERHAKLRRVQAHRTLSERLAASPSRPCLRRCRPRASKARKIELDVSISRRCENGKVIILKSSVLMDAAVALDPWSEMRSCASSGTTGTLMAVVQSRLYSTCARHSRQEQKCSRRLCGHAHVTKYCTE